MINTLLTFAIFSTLPILLLWACYRGVLSKCNYSFGFNRAFIIAGLLGIVAWFAVDRRTPSDDFASTTDASISYTQAEKTIKMDSAKTETIIPAFTADSSAIDLRDIISWLYIIGLTIVATNTVISIVRILDVLRKCTIRTVGDTRIHVSPDDDVAPMSIGHTIIMNEADFYRDAEMIIAHEKAHVEKAHTADMILIQVLATICWFNPALWALRAQIRKLHEFQADAKVLSYGHDSEEYQKMLIYNSVSNARPQFANYLSYKQLKSRISMMNSKKSTWRHLLWLVPAIALSLAAISSCTESVDKAINTACATDMPTFKNFEEYRNIGTTATARKNKLREKPEYDEKTAFVIYGVDMRSDNFKKGDFLWRGDLAYSGMPDASYDGFSYPLSRAVVTLRKSTIDMLAPNVKSFIINGRKANRAQFDALPGEAIQSITIDGNTLIVEKRFSLDQPNVDIPKVGDDEARIARRLYPEEIKNLITARTLKTK
ncbi:MAG: M56 family metallopeptidase [Muribaculaceae bacterium]|nr:M56 family metallopeptidase [Muribaculaceae bacterium]